MLLIFVIFIVALTSLVKGADWFISGAEHFGQVLGIPSFIIGVTLVAIGTSLPELATSIAGIYMGESNIVISNVVGSNITNILLVLGIVASMHGNIKLHGDILHIDIPLFIMSAFLLYFTLLDSEFSLLEAGLFLIALVFFLTHSLTGEKEEEHNRPKLQIGKIGLFLVGGALVYLGAKYTIDSLLQISEVLGISSDAITLSLVALGTSLPEVVVSLSAAKRGQTAIAIGNILGSNIFNTYAVMAIARCFGTLAIPVEITEFYLPFMMAISFIFGISCLSNKISRWEGLMLILFYAFFLITLINQNI